MLITSVYSVYPILFPLLSIYLNLLSPIFSGLILYEYILQIKKM